MSFDDWFAELRRLAAPYVQRGLIAEAYLDPKSWRDYFEDGYTPAAAWHEDMSYWQK